MRDAHVGVLGLGIYLPQGRMSAKDIAEATKGLWTEANVIEKLGIIEKPIPSRGCEDGTQDDSKDGTQAMGVYAAKDALRRTGLDPKTIDLILCMGEEWKEYPLTTSGIYIQEQIGAVNAWAIDVQQRCCSTVSAIKIAKDMLLADDDLHIAMVVGGYRNGDFVDYTDPNMSMMYNLSAGGGAIILQKNLGKNVVLGSHIMSDGSMARDAGVFYGGICHPIASDNLELAYSSLKLLDAEHMKTRLNDVSMPNWLMCIDKALEKSKIARSDIDYLAILHFKRSMHYSMLDLLGLEKDKSIYLENYGHMGQIDQLLSMHLALEKGMIKDGDHIALVAAGIGYAWAAGVIRWGQWEA
jgi:3-oxoacyl-[acyl-carrier-protein] synthase-3